MTDAVDMLKEHTEKHPEGLQQSGFNDGFVLEDQCVKLMSTCSEKNDVTQSIQLANVLFDCGYIRPAAFSVLEQLVNGYLKK